MLISRTKAPPCMYRMVFLAFSSPKVKIRVPLKSILLKILFTDLEGAFNCSFRKSFTFSFESMNLSLVRIKIASSIFATSDLLLDIEKPLVLNCNYHTV